LKILQRGFHSLSQTIEHRQPVPDKVRLGRLFGQLLQVSAASFVVAGVHQRNGEVVMLLYALETRAGAGSQLLIAGVQVDGGAVSQFAARPRGYLLQQGLGTLKLALLHGLESGLVVLHSLCKTWVILERRLGLGFRWGHGLTPTNDHNSL